jgi:hypothetical protein
MAASAAKQRYDWLVYSIKTWKQVARLPYEPGTQSVLLLGRRAFYLVAGPVSGPIDRPTSRPQLVQAVELKTGKTLWQRPVAGRHLSPPPPR